MVSLLRLKVGRDARHASQLRCANGRQDSRRNLCRMLSVTLRNVDSRLSLLVQTLEFAEMVTYMDINVYQSGDVTASLLSFR